MLGLVLITWIGVVYSYQPPADGTDECPGCRDGEVAVRVEADLSGGMSFLTLPPCTEDMGARLASAIQAGAIETGVFVLKARPDSRPQWFRELLVGLPADYQHLLARLSNGFTSECAVLGAVLEEGAEYRGYRLSASSPKTAERSCDPVSGDCRGFHSTGFSITPRLIEVDGKRIVFTVFRNYSHHDNFNGPDRTGILTLYLRP